MASLVKIEGIGEVNAGKLAKVGIKTTQALLEAGATRKGRDQLAKDSKISVKRILTFVNKADLFRVSGIGEEYSDLLEVAGVDTVPELAQRKAANLQEAIKKANDKRNLVRRVPGEKMVEGWIKQAKKLKRVVKY